MAYTLPPDHWSPKDERLFLELAREVLQDGLLAKIHSDGRLDAASPLVQAQYARLISSMRQSDAYYSYLREWANAQTSFAPPAVYPYNPPNYPTNTFVTHPFPSYIPSSSPSSSSDSNHDAYNSIVMGEDLTHDESEATESDDSDSENDSDADNESESDEVVSDDADSDRSDTYETDSTDTDSSSDDDDDDEVGEVGGVRYRPMPMPAPFYYGPGGWYPPPQRPW